MVSSEIAVVRVKEGMDRQESGGAVLVGCVLLLLISAS